MYLPFESYLIFVFTVFMLRNDNRFFMNCLQFRCDIYDIWYKTYVCVSQKSKLYYWNNRKQYCVIIYSPNYKGLTEKFYSTIFIFSKKAKTLFVQQKSFSASDIHANNSPFGIFWPPQNQFPLCQFLQSGFLFLLSRWLVFRCVLSSYRVVRSSESYWIFFVWNTSSVATSHGWRVFSTWYLHLQEKVWSFLKGLKIRVKN